jgi:4-diphosphocytidyl-2-C-methyl-D-erythritol kinase
MPALTETAYAKINLALHVRTRRDDGYHELETLFAFADQGDVLTGELSDGLELEIVGPFSGDLASGADNLVTKAAMALRQAVNTQQGARLVLEKNLPIASGIGGGSADAAAALRLLAKLWDAHIDLMPIAASLGADVPACLLSQSSFGTGVGDHLSPYLGEGITGSSVLLVNPGIACPTGPIFKAWDGIDRGSLEPLSWRDARNDLEVPAIRLFPKIGTVLVKLRAQPGINLARMSGSGATCFGLFETPAHRDAACAMIARYYPDWWTMVARLR